MNAPGEKAQPDYTLRILKEFLQTAVPLYTIRFKDLPWEDLKQIMRESEKVLEELGELAVFTMVKKGETAKAFNAIAKAIAALSFVPQGIDIFGLHFETKYEGPTMGRVNHDAPISGEPVIGLTEKGLQFDRALRGALHMLMTEVGLKKWMTCKEHMEAAKRIWGELWKNIGMELTALKGWILRGLRYGPLDLTEIMVFAMVEVPDATSDEFEKTIERMLNAGLLTDDPSQMWSERQAG